MDRRNQDKKRALSHADLEQIANESFSESGVSDEFYEPSSSEDEDSDLEDDTEAEADGAIATSDSEGVENEVIGNVNRPDNPDGVIDPDVVTETVVHPNSEVGNGNEMIVFYVFFLFYSVNCARILGVQHIAAHSHYTLIDTILKELAHRGHNVTMITTFQQKTPVKNFKSIHLTGMLEQVQAALPNVVDAVQQSIFVKNIHYEMMGLNVTEETLKHPNVQQLLKSNETFDLVVLEQFLNEGLRGFCYHYNAHCVTVSSVMAGRWANPHVANSAPPSAVPDLLVPFSNNMNFLQRLYNTIIYSFGSTLSQLYFLPKQNELLQKYFPKAPNVYELMYNTSLILVNSHVSINFAMAYVPNMIEVGGFHISTPKQLPKDLQSFLDDAKDGAVYFSMGSYLQTALFPENLKEQLLSVFSKIKQKVLFKWHNSSLDTKYSNILIQDWFPQNDVLAHPNVKLFITHGGLLSTTEAVYHGVPLLGLPIFGDQMLNIANAVTAGYAVALPFQKFTVNNFRNALNEALYNPKYSANMHVRNRIFHSRPSKPLDTAMYWIEYVLEYNGADHLKTSALRLKWVSLKDEIYKQRYQNVDELENAITNTLHNMDGRILLNVIRSGIGQAQKCIEQENNDFDHLYP
ncbi:hypothetical protein RN001_012454 [Aquatica leii]|uniref:Uncharacterized protein n=1 Tax=Aquatica leii TaxID=1421715 RepID=A0AAN7SDB2_9COLE|nr:hypothetical protein RN001_012454 [Aquatica leii]